MRVKPSWHLLFTQNLLVMTTTQITEKSHSEDPFSGFALKSVDDIDKLPVTVKN